MPFSDRAAQMHALDAAITHWEREHKIRSRMDLAQPTKAIAEPSSCNSNGARPLQPVSKKAAAACDAAAPPGQKNT
ncbi:hypothetical protein BJS_09029 [Bradyrhizobium japonicum SEMIA 5079]|nr:hypothetical protein BJS_09029 [Bradyrhizobium japonicum SEMIA 5079]